MNQVVHPPARSFPFLRKKLLHVYISLLLALCAPACVREDFGQLSDKLTWSPYLTLPIGSTTMSINQTGTLPGTSLIDANQNLLLQYTDTLLLPDKPESAVAYTLSQAVARLYFSNDFPAELQVLLFFETAGQMVPLGATNLIAAGAISNESRPMQPGILLAEIPLPDALWDQSTQNPRLILHFSSGSIPLNEEFIRHLSEFKIHTKAGLRAKFQIEFGE